MTVEWSKRCFLTLTYIVMKIISWYDHSIIIKISIKYQNINYQTKIFYQDILINRNPAPRWGFMKDPPLTRVSVEETSTWFAFHTCSNLFKIWILHLLSIFREHITTSLRFQETLRHGVKRKTTTIKNNNCRYQKEPKRKMKFVCLFFWRKRSGWIIGT